MKCVWILGLAALSLLPARSDELETRFRELPNDARRLTGPLFWLHGDENETPERLAHYIEKIAEGGNGCFTAESRPHADWLGPGWYRDLGICLEAARKHDLQMWIFDEKWWPSQSIGGTVPPAYAAKSLVAETTDLTGPENFKADGHHGDRYIATVAGRLNEAGEIEGGTLLDLAPFISDGNLIWKVPPGQWQVIRFRHEQAPGLGQGGGRELSVDGASRDCVEWFLKTVYQPHFDRFGDDFGERIPGFFYDEPETRGDWGTEVPVILEEWGVDWKKAYVAYKLKLAGDDHDAARYQYMEALAEAWGRVMYGGMTRWCEERGVKSIGHFMEHNMLYLKPDYCAGDMMRLQKYSSMGGIDLVVRQMYPGQRPHDIYQTPKLGSSISHVYGKQDDLAMCEIFGGYGQVLTYSEMKWLTDQHQVRGINFMIPHAFNPKAPNDKDYPPYFYNDGHETRWPLYRIWADYTSRLSLMLTGGHHVCPVAILFSGNVARVGEYVTPEDLTTVLQDALYDADWLPFEAFENLATLDRDRVALHGERYRVLVVPPTEVIPHATLAKAKAFFDQGGVVVGYGRLPDRSGTPGIASSEITALRDAIWGGDLKPSTTASNRNARGGRAYILPEKPDVATLTAALHGDAGVAPVIEVVEGDTGGQLHVLHRVKEGRDVFLICNQDHEGSRRDFRLRIPSKGNAEIWDAMRGEITSVPVTSDDAGSILPLSLEPMESVLVVFQPEKRVLPLRLTQAMMDAAEITPVPNTAWRGAPFKGRFELPDTAMPPGERIFIEITRPTSEDACRVAVNGVEAGGFIGAPYRLDITRHLKAGSNEVTVGPFGPTAVHLLRVGPHGK
ncbi:glycosyl hydrolase [Haloferula sp. A504]|uniref:glycosyl hydrolase n=1 Tax=Haloferula sp. A504 TaxID=3373601 RepID=UPI0031C04052|nr:hypothetical protein [Verrucomicrobiaceae bacterium E54]